MTRLVLLTSILLTSISAPAFAGLVLTQNDGATPKIYANGGGGGFGGTLGNGSISMDVVGTNVVIGFTPGNSLNDIVALLLDTRTGGLTDALMNDTADGSRRALSNLTANDDDVYPIGVLPDFGVAFGNFGTVLFELQPGTNLNFLSFTGTVGSITIPLATLGNPAQIDFFAGYTADSGFNSNESLPFTSAGINQESSNPGFGTGGVHTYDNFDRFITTAAAAVPEPGTMLVWGLVMITVGLVTKRIR